MGNGIDESRSGTVVTKLSGDRLVDSVLDYRRWTDRVLTFSFPTAQSAWASYYSSNDDYLSLVPMGDALKAAVRAALRSYERVINLRFEEVTETRTLAGDIRVAMSSTVRSDLLAYTYLPSERPRAGDVWFKQSSSTGSATPGTYLYTTALHEIGHALGLKHPHESDTTNPNVLPASLDSTDLTVMSYNDLPNRNPITPMALDIKALQYLYGANTTVTAGSDAYAVGAGPQTVWDAGGTDTLDFSAARGDATITLASGNWSKVAGVNSVFVMDGVSIENATGGAGNDVITGNALANTLRGNGGTDRIDGGAGTDTAWYASSRSAYQVSRSGSTITVSGPDGSDTLTSIERLTFSDGTLALDTTDTAAQAYRLYRAALGRTPDDAGLGYQTNRLEQGTSLENVAAGFIASPEFQAKYGALSSDSYVDQLYRNVLERGAAASEIAYHVGRLAQGVSRQGILVGFSESPENIAKVAALTPNGIWYA
jgi:Ca2+-binding RTX toxin-like protein